MSTGSLAVSTKLDGNQIAIKQELEAGFFQNVRMTLPASITIQSGLNTPRYPSLKGIMGAKKKEIKTISFNDLNVTYENKLNVISVEEPPVRQAGVMVPSVEELVEKLKNEAKVI